MTLRISTERLIIQLITVIFFMLFFAILITSISNQVLTLFFGYLYILFFGIEFWRVLVRVRELLRRYWEYLRPPHPEIREQIEDAESLKEVFQAPFPDREYIDFTEISPEPLEVPMLMGWGLFTVGFIIFMGIALGVASLEQQNVIDNLAVASQSTFTTSFAILAVLLGPVFGILAIVIQMGFSELGAELVVFLLILFVIPTVFIAPALRNIIYIIENLHLWLIEKIEERPRSPVTHRGVSFGFMLLYLAIAMAYAYL